MTPACCTELESFGPLCRAAGKAQSSWSCCHTLKGSAFFHKRYRTPPHSKYPVLHFKRLFWSTQWESHFLLYFDQINYNLKPKSMYFSLSCWSTFYCGSYTFLFFSCFSEICITTLASQTSQNAEYCTPKAS